MVKFIIFLSFFSGVCGIAYEILYSRLLTTCFGDMFYVVAAILSSFLLALGVGSFTAEKWARHLWKIEILIGFCALVLGAVFGFYSDEVIRLYLPKTGGSPLWIILSVSVVLGVPAFLIGFSVPLFSLYLEGCMKGEQKETLSFHSFREVYYYYNLGAVFCVLGVEFFLIRSFGIRGTIFSVALLNLLIGILLKIFYEKTALFLRPESPVFTPVKKEEVLLFFASLLSGIFQLLFLKIAETLFGPYHENFAIILAVGLFSLSFSASFVSGVSRHFGGWLIAGSFSCLLSFILFHPMIYLWAWLNETFSWTSSISTFIKIEILFLIGIIPLTVFGGTVPALIKSDEKVRPGRLLGISSFGNCAGYLLMVFVIHEHFSSLVLVFWIGLSLLGMGIFCVKNGFRQKMQMLSAFALLSCILWIFWPVRLMDLCYDDFKSLEAIQKQETKYDSFESLKKLGHHVSLLQEKNQTCLVIDGYKSLHISKGKKGNLREILFGFTPACFLKEQNSALVLGVGTGITAGSAAKVFKRVKAVDINPLMFQILPLFTLQNFDLQHSPNVEFVFNDGLVELAGDHKRYDAIINTVTTPLFFSSSKLYTKDFFSLVSGHLNENGIYAFWFDCRVGSRGAEIIYETVKQSFNYCAMVYLSHSYVQMICSQSPLKVYSLADSSFPEEIAEVFKAHRITLKPEEFVSSLILTEHSIYSREWRQRPNTFDFPVLEFAMSSFALHNPGLEDQNLYARAGADLLQKPVLDSIDHALEKRAAALWFLGNRFILQECLKKKPVFDLRAYADFILPALLHARGGAREILNLCEFLLMRQDEEKCLQVLGQMTKYHFRVLPVPEQKELKMKQKKMIRRVLHVRKENPIP